MKPKLSVVVCAFNMNRELPRTLRSLSPLMQRGICVEDYEVIMVDNGSSQTASYDVADFGGLNLHTIYIPTAEAKCSPAEAMNIGIRRAQGKIICAMIDGARMASPGLLACALTADRIGDRVLTLSLAFHLGPKVQMESIVEGYNQEKEDRILAKSGWREDGYRLFNISVLAGSSQGGWFKPIAESNAFFMRQALWQELGGFDERFITPGGGLVNLDTLSRAVNLPGIETVTLLGEGTFHQVHGGVATNARVSIYDQFASEYEFLRGSKFKPCKYQTIYLGIENRQISLFQDRLNRGWNAH